MQFDPQLEHNLTYLGATIALFLLLFGVAYNWLTAWLEKTGRDKGFTALLVVGGTLVTVLATMPLIGFINALIILGAFMCSGLPMTVGSIWRYMDKRIQATPLPRKSNWERNLEEDLGHG